MSATITPRASHLVSPSRRTRSEAEIPFYLKHRTSRHVLLALAVAGAGMALRPAPVKAATPIYWQVNPETDVTGDTDLTGLVSNTNTTGIVAGQIVAGSGIPVGDTVFFVNDSTSLYLSVVPTAAVVGDALAFSVPGAGTWSNAVNWVGGVPPANDLVTNLAVFDSASYGTFQPNFLAAEVGVNGMVFGDGTTVTGAITISGLRPQLGDGGIVVKAHSGPVTIATGIQLLASQTWSNASSSVLNIGGGIRQSTDLGDITGTLNLVNTGTGSIVTGLANDATGILPSWVTYTNASGTFYATNTGGGTVGAFAGTAVTDPTAASLASSATNYDLHLTGSNIITGAAAANTLRYTGGSGTIQINGAGTLTTNGILNASGGALNIAAGPGATGGIIMGASNETAIMPTTGSVELGAAIINPATNVGQRYYLTIGAGNTVGVNAITNNSADGSGLLIGASMGTSAGGSFLTIGASGNLTLNAASGPIYSGDAVTDAQGGGDNDTNGPADLHIAESVPGSTLTIAGTHIVSLSGDSSFTGGLIMMPGANLYINSWTTGGQLGTGPITFMGNNTMAKYLNTFTATYNNRINLNGDVEFTGAPVGNTHSWGNENNALHFVSDGNAGTGEVHLGASVTINTDVQPDPFHNTVADPGQATPVYFGGIFDDGQGYSITKTGGGVLYFFGSAYYGDAQSSNFTGSLTVLAGVLQLGEYGPAADPITSRVNVVTVDTGAEFYVNNGNQTIAGLNDGPNGGGTVGSDVVVTLAGSGNYSFSGALFATATIVKGGSGTQTLSGTSSYTGGTSVNGGKLVLNFGGVNAPAGGADLLYNVAAEAPTPVAAANLSLGGGTLQMIGAAGAVNSQRFGAISVSGGSAITLTSNGAASLALNTSTITRSSGGTLAFTLPSGAQNVANGVLTTASNTNGILGGYAVVVGAGGAVDWAVSGATHIAAGVNEGDVGTWDGDGQSPEALEFYGNVANGTGVSFSNITGNPVAPDTVFNPGQLYYVVGSGGGIFKIVDVPGATTPIGNNQEYNGTAAIDIQGNVTGLATYDAFVGTGGLATSNASLTGSGSVTASESLNTLKIATSAAGQSLSLASGKTLTLTSGGLLLTGTNDYTISGDATTGLTSGGTDLILQQYATGSLTISAPITGAVGLTKAGPGKLILTGANTFSGAVNLSGGTVEINALQALGNGAAITFNGVTLRYATGFTGGGDVTTTPGAGTAAGRSVVISGNGLTVDTNGNTVTFANGYGFQNGISGSGGLTKTGAGTLILDNNYVGGQSNSYTGPTTISGGTLQIGPDALIVNGGAANEIVTAGANPAYNSAIGKSSYAAENLVLDGGTFQYLGAATSTDRSFTVTQNGGTIDSSNASNAALVFSNTSKIAVTGSGARTLTLTGTSTGGNALDLGIKDGTGGATSVVKNGTGTWLLNGTSTYTGATTVNSGTLGGSGTLASAIVAGSAAHTIAPSATLAGNTATTLTVGGLTTNTHTTLAFNLNTPYNTITHAASVSDKIVVNGNVNLTGGGTLSITNTNHGQPSLGYYKAIAYTTLTVPTAPGTANLGITMPTVSNGIAYVLDTAHDAGFIDIHRGFLGDANDDGIVNAIDLGILATNYNSTTANWSEGDYNGDGIVNAIDLGILATNYNATIGLGSFDSAVDAYPTLEAALGGATNVPEPASLALLGLGAAGLLTRRRRRA